MQELKVKRVKKDIFLDLSAFNTQDKEFTSKISKEIERSASFFSGNAVSIILPDTGESESNTEIGTHIKSIQDALNKNNISLKASYLPGDIEKLNLQSSSNTQEDEPCEITSNTNEKEPSDEQEYNIPDTLYVKSNLRAGHLIRYPGNVIIYGDVNPSAEIIAAGDVIIWGNCRGTVQAGSNHDSRASISALKFNNCQLRIADSFLDLSKHSKKRKTDKNNFFNGAELAKLENNEIIIYTS